MNVKLVIVFKIEALGDVMTNYFLHKKDVVGEPK